MRSATVIMHNRLAGILREDENGYHFSYNNKYLVSDNPEAISLTIPLQSEPYSSNILFPFFDGLIPEGWLLDIAIKNWKLNTRDRMSLLLATCQDCIGAVSIEEINEDCSQAQNNNSAVA